MLLTHCGLVTPYVARDLVQHWLRWWLVAWRHQAITWTNVDLSSVMSNGIHLRAILQEIPQSSVTKISLKITYLKCCSNLPGANELMWNITTRTVCPINYTHGCALQQSHDCHSVMAWWIQGGKRSICSLRESRPTKTNKQTKIRKNKETTKRPLWSSNMPHGHILLFFILLYTKRKKLLL